MIWKAYELKAHLDNLILTDGPDGQVEWIGKAIDWNKVEKEIEYHENNL